MDSLKFETLRSVSEKDQRENLFMFAKENNRFSVQVIAQKRSKYIPVCSGIQDQHFNSQFFLYFFFAEQISANGSSSTVIPVRKIIDNN